MRWNLRHLRVFLAVHDTSSVTQAAQRCNLSQPAVTQAIAKLEAMVQAQLFQHRTQGLYATAAGDILARRIARALGILDAAGAQISARLAHHVTTSQLRALIALRERKNFTLAARALGLAQPTVHRAISQLEDEAQRRLFERSPTGLRPLKACHLLADAARSMFIELDQAVMELEEHAGRETGQIVIGSMPLARSTLLSMAILNFRAKRPRIRLQVIDGPYEDMLQALRSGDIDMIIGALRYPAPIGDITQEPLFSDDLVLVVRQDHPLMTAAPITLDDLASYPWVVPRAGTPTRTHFDGLFAGRTGHNAAPESIVETGSLIVMRELLRNSDHIGCISRAQVLAEIDHHAMAVLPFDLGGTNRTIGLTTRTEWLPTATQSDFLDELRKATPVPLDREKAAIAKMNE